MWSLMPSEILESARMQQMMSCQPFAESLTSWRACLVLLLWPSQLSSLPTLFWALSADFAGHSCSCCESHEPWSWLHNRREAQLTVKCELAVPGHCKQLEGSMLLFCSQAIIIAKVSGHGPRSHHSIKLVTPRSVGQSISDHNNLWVAIIVLIATEACIWEQLGDGKAYPWRSRRSDHSSASRKGVDGSQIRVWIHIRFLLSLRFLLHSSWFRV